MEIKTAFSSQFNHDAAIKGSGLLNMFFFLSQVASMKSRKHRNDILRCFFLFTIIIIYIYFKWNRYK